MTSTSVTGDVEHSARKDADLLSDYIASTPSRHLPEEVFEKTSLHILDSVAASVSGMTLEAGRHARDYVSRCGASGESTVFGSSLRSSVSFAAMANGMAAHADETDDAHAPSRTHPGCSIVPSALAVGEYRGSSGEDLVRAVALGYDICGRVPQALWSDLIEGGGLDHCLVAVGGLFGSAAAASYLLGHDAQKARFLLSYATQHSSGLNTFMRETQHVEKAYVFGGMPSFNGTTIAFMVDAGWTGVDDVFSGKPSFYSLGPRPNPDALTQGLGTHFEVMVTKFKKYPAGSPAQSPLDGLLAILRDNDLSAAAVKHVLVRLSPPRFRTVRRREMGNLNIDYLLHVALEDTTLTFQAAHDEVRFRSWQDSGLDSRITVEADPELGLSHAAHVDVEMSDGRTFTHFVPAIPGSSENPMSRDDVESKALGLLAPTLGIDRAQGFIADSRHLEDVADVRGLTTWLSV